MEQPLPNAGTGRANESENDPEPQSIAEQVRDAIFQILGIGNENVGDDQADDDTGREGIEGENLPAPDRSSPRQENPSQVRCEPIALLFVATN